MGGRAARRARSLLRRGLHPLRARKRRALLARLKGGLDRAALEAARKELEPHAPGPEGAVKYFDVERYLGINLDRVLALGLHRSRPLRILDLGCGFGYFLFACAHFGHDAIGLDFSDGNHPFAARCYARSVAILKQRRVLHEIRAFEPLPPLGRPFDLVTAFQVCFDDHASETRWGVAEWEAFLTELRGLLNPEGRVHLELNAAPDGGLFASELRAYLVSLGGRIEGPAVSFEPAATLPGSAATGPARAPGGAAS
jgi:SAM-dependent methyltransferase